MLPTRIVRVLACDQGSHQLWDEENLSPGL